MTRARPTLAATAALAVSAAALGALGPLGPVAAQERPRAPAPAAAPGRVLIVNARVEGHDGPVSILVLGGKVRAVGAALRATPGVPRLDVAGARVLPGRIDAWASVPGGDPLGRGLDGLDRRDPALRQALAQGVTTLFVAPRGAAPLAGVGAIVKLRTDGEPAVVSSEAAVCASLGGPDASPLVRARLWGELRAALVGARRWREANEDYEEALAKWLAGQPAGVGSATPAAPAPSSPATEPAPSGDEPPGPRGPRRRRPRPGGAADDPTAPEAVDPAALDPDPDAVDTAPDPPKPPPDKPAPDKPAPDKPAPDKPAPDKPAAPALKPGEKPPERPKLPAPDRVSKLLLRVLDGELPLRVEAHRAEDVLNALDLAAELGVPRLVVEGGDEAGLVAAELARARVPVVLGPGLAPGEAELGRALRASPAADLARRLAAARVPLAVGSGDVEASPGLPLGAALHAGHGLPRAAADAAITAAAAEVLGLGDRLGRIAPGYDADLVVVEDDPLAGPLVRATLVEGVLVHRRAP